jgi:menaquinol-cytochrome c reductase iron-sulfur subunit
MSSQKVSRRQFLNYTLMGVGGFMGAATLMPMLRFAVDPALKANASGEFINTGLKISEITETPTRVDYKTEVKDGWYEAEETRTAWVYKDENGKIVALSPECKHLGCTVNWEGSEDHKNEFYCPCHGGVTKRMVKTFRKHLQSDRSMFTTSRKKMEYYTWAMQKKTKCREA